MKDLILATKILSKLIRNGRLSELQKLEDKGRIIGSFVIERFENDIAVAKNRPYNISDPFFNSLLNGGMVEIWKSVTAQSGTAFSNANAYLGVGDSSNAVVVTQTDLQAASNKLRKAMNGGFPNAPVNGLEQWQSDFGSSEANYSWQEYGVFNASSGVTMMNRSLSNQGTKTSGQTWRLTYSITLS